MPLVHIAAVYEFSRKLYKERIGVGKNKNSKCQKSLDEVHCEWMIVFHNRNEIERNCSEP